MCLAKKNTLIAFIVAILTIAIGFSFAYFVSSVLITGEGASVGGKTSSLLKVTYNAGSGALSLNEAIPGDIASKDFTVKITPTENEKEVTYAIKFNIDTNTFEVCDDDNYSASNECTKNAEEIIYRLKNGNEVLASGNLTEITGDKVLLTETKNVETETTFTYTLEIEFVNTNADQNHNANKTLSGNIKVEFADKPIYLNNQILADNPTISTRSSFSSVLTSDTTGTIYQAEDDDGTTYYFAGDTSNNWVQFAGFYWRIIRINGDGSVRLIYNGTSTAETGTSTQLSSTSTFNSSYNRSEYVGFKYTTSSQYGTGTKSTILTALDTWYTSNLAGHEDQIELNAGFCNDRTMAGGYSWSSQPSSEIYYAAYDRVYSPYTPTYKCSNSNDLFTDSKATRGNKSLDNPIGLITADEVMYAGGKGGTANQNYYLYTGQYYWTLSPYYFHGSNRNAYVFTVHSSGRLDDYVVIFTYGVRPVINLKASVTVSGGNGTASSPYVVT